MSRVDELISEVRELRESIVREAARLGGFTEALQTNIERLRDSSPSTGAEEEESQP